jgi:hypothetical protein
MRSTLALSVFGWCSAIVLSGCSSGVTIEYVARLPDAPPRDAATVGVVDIDCPDPLTDPRQCTDVRGTPLLAETRGAFRASRKAFDHWASFRERAVTAGARHGCDAVAIRRMPPNTARDAMPIGGFCITLPGGGAVSPGPVGGELAPAPLRRAPTGICSATSDCPPPERCVHGSCE